MGVEYVSVQWNRQKKLYDAVLVGCVATFLLLFAVVSKVMFPRITDEILLIRAFGTAAFVLLHVILCIGPLCRLNPAFLPLLYNRRHAGVTCFLLGLIHAVLAVATYHAGSDTNPILSIFISSPITSSVAGVPFQPFGFFALFILFLMAATSHDFWLANLSAPAWKSLHMLVYVAYALLALHVTFGVLQGEGSPVYVGAMGLGLATIIGLHTTTGLRERNLDATSRISHPASLITTGHSSPKEAVTAQVRQAQETYFGRSQDAVTASKPDELTKDESAFVQARDSFYMATVNPDGWPYIQHRGGHAGFLSVLNSKTLAFPDYRGNRQLLSTGNIVANDRVALFLMDYPQRTRLKILGHSRVEDARQHPELVQQLAEPGAQRIVERLFFIRVIAFDWNCPKYITPRFTAGEILEVTAPLKARIAELEARLRTEG